MRIIPAHEPHAIDVTLGERAVVPGGHDPELDEPRDVRLRDAGLLSELLGMRAVTVAMLLPPG